MGPEPALAPPKREWIVCGLCGLTTRITSREVGIAAIEHAMSHETMPPDALPETPGARC